VVHIPTCLSIELELLMALVGEPIYQAKKAALTDRMGPEQDEG